MKTDALIDSLSRQVQPVSQVPSPLTLALLWVGASALWVAGFTALRLGVLVSLPTSLGDARWSLAAVAWVALLVSASTLAFHLALPGRRIRPWQFVAPGILFAVACTAIATYGVPLGVGWREGLAISGFDCTCALLELASIPLVLFFVMMRRLACIDSAGAGLCLGVAAGAFAAAGLMCHCTSQHFVHLLIYHCVPVALLALAARTLARRLLRW